MNNILRITDPILSDNSIDRYEDVEYEPQARIQISFSGGGGPTENALILLYDTLISGFQWM